jgi:hypothetical protein
MAKAYNSMGWGPQSQIFIGEKVVGAPGIPSVPIISETSSSSNVNVSWSGAVNGSSLNVKYKLY